MDLYFALLIFAFFFITHSYKKKFFGILFVCLFCFFSLSVSFFESLDSHVMLLLENDGFEVGFLLIHVVKEYLIFLYV